MPEDDRNVMLPIDDVNPNNNYKSKNLSARIVSRFFNLSYLEFIIVTEF